MSSKDDFNADEWGNLGGDSLLDPKINIKLANKKKAKDPEWLALKAKQNADPVIRAKRKASMPDQSGENNSFYGRTHTKETKKKLSDLKKGKTAHNKGTKHTDEALKKMRKPRSEKGKQAIKEAIRLARAKPENFSDCSHCGLLHISNQNYKKYHGDQCWLKGKLIVAYIDEKVLFTYTNIIDIQSEHSLTDLKGAIKHGHKYKKMFWKLITV
jgi:hypothetical protein